MILGNLSQDSSRPTDHRFFSEIRESCARELKGKGFDTEVYLLHGGVGIRILNHDHPSIAQIAHLPISEFDFSLVFNPALEGLSFFKLEGLRLSKTPPVAFSELSIFSLKRLHADGCMASDLPLLCEHPLEELSLRQSGLTSLHFLSGIALKALFLSGNPIETIADLSTESLSSLDLLKCPVTSLESLQGSPIEELNVSGTKVFDLSPLADSPLKKLEMRSTQISNLAALAESPLEVLHLPGSPVQDLGPLSYLPIRELNLVGLRIEDLSPLCTMPLKKLSLSPDKLDESQFDLLRGLDLSVLKAAADDEGQGPAEFFKKYA